MEWVEVFRRLREPNVALWKRVEPMQLRRFGLHNECGRETLDKYLVAQAGHDFSQIDQVRRYLATVRESQSARSACFETRSALGGCHRNPDSGDPSS